MKARGFTLIEVMVSVAIFSLVMVIALGALLAISVSARKAESLKSVINNLNFSLDSLSRSIRTGTNWNCASLTGGDCTAGGKYLNFVPANGVGKVYYRLESATTDPANAASICNQVPPVGCLARSTDGTTWLPITSSEVVISDAAPVFYIVGSPAGPDTTQPKLVISVSGYVRLTGGAASQAVCGSLGNQCSVFRLQTAVTQRIYDQ